MTPPTIRTMRTGEADEAVDLAARAFHEDPLFTHLHPDPAARPREFAIEHAAYLRRLYFPVGNAESAVVDGRLAGIALWLPPNALSGLEWREWLCIPALLRAVGWSRTRSMLREYAAFNEAFPTDLRFHYLGLLAVDPSVQGQGVGSALLTAGLARADAESVGAYLETGTPGNVAFYERHGFSVVREIVPPTAPRHWAMWRDARPPRPAHDR